MDMSAILLAATLAASAQPPVQAPGRNAEATEIVVEAERVGDREVQQFIRAMTPAERGIQIGQFDQGVCPVVVGLGESQKAAVEARMRRVAVAAGVPAAGAKCSANILVIVAPDKKEAIKAVRKERPGLVSGLSASDFDELLATPGPAAAWHFTERAGSDGLHTTKDLEGISFAASFNTPSRTRFISRPRFLGSVLVIEMPALAGVSTIQLADYAALRTFAGTDPERAAKAGSPTILTLLQDRAAGRALRLSLTHWDLSFLKSLYATSNTDIDAVQRASMKQAFKRDMRRKAKTREQ